MAKCWVTIRADTSGLTSDVQDVIPSVEGAMQDMVSNVNTAFAGINISGPVQEEMEKMSDAVPEAMDNAKDALAGADLPNPVAHVVEGVRTSGAEITTILESMTGRIKSWMALVGVVWSFSALIGVAKQATGAAEESINTQLRLRGLLEATGNTTGYTANQLVRMSQELRDTMNASAGSIQGVMTRLAMFGSISDEVFEKAVKASINLSKVTGMAPESVARMIGSALENPMQGLGRLKWMGVSLNKEQKEQIKNYVESGEKLKATVMLMEIIEGKSKGIAEEMAKTPTGQLDALRMKLEGLRKELGEKLIPLAIKFAEVGLKIQGVFNVLIGGIKATLEWFDSWGVTAWRVIKSLSYLVVVTSSYWIGLKAAVVVMGAFHRVGLLIVSVTNAMKTAQMGYNAVMMAGRVGMATGVATALGAVVTGGASLVIGLAAAGVSLWAMNNMMQAAETSTDKAAESMNRYASSIIGVKNALEDLTGPQRKEADTVDKLREANRILLLGEQAGAEARKKAKEEFRAGALEFVTDVAEFRRGVGGLFGKGEMTDEQIEAMNKLAIAAFRTQEAIAKYQRVVTVTVPNMKMARLTEEEVSEAMEGARKELMAQLDLYEEAKKKANIGEKEGKGREAEEAGKTERSVRMAFPELSNQIQDAIMKKGADAPTRQDFKDLGKSNQDDANKIVEAIKENKNAPAVLAQK